MLLVVCGISSLVHLYSIEYLAGDPHQGRFMAYLSLFTGFMLILVSADNFIIMFLGWEGIGLSSFLLIGFWYTRIQAGKAAVKAMIVNRVGDIGLALAISAIFLTFKSVDYFVVFSLIPNAINTEFSFLLYNIDRLSVIAFLLFWGAVGKSAQIGLHMWLPDAMEGPTPVSALIHAATLVTAGVFLMIRCSVIFENSCILPIIVAFGGLTCFFASSVGVVQNDIKRVIAYSTCSQLGYMVFCAGLSNYSIAFFHLVNHALFKALLFLSAGCIIHGISDEQDLRKMGSLVKIFPVSYTMILIGSLALVGFPFLTGFFSKDAILEIALTKYNCYGFFAHSLGCLAAVCTSFYSFRLIFLAFINDSNAYKSCIHKAHEAPFIMIFPLLILALGAIFWGFLTKDLMIGLGTPLFGNSIINNTYLYNQLDGEFLSSYLKNIPFFCTFLGLLLSLIFVHSVIFSKRDVFTIRRKPFMVMGYTFLTQKWNFDQLMNELVTLKILNFGYKNTFLALDKGLIETFGPTGLSSNFLLLSNNLARLQTGFLGDYNLFIFMSIIILVGFCLVCNTLLSYLCLLVFSYSIICLQDD